MIGTQRRHGLWFYVLPPPLRESSRIKSLPITLVAVAALAACSRTPLDDPLGGLAARSVFFAYDEFTVDAKYQPRVQVHGKLLQSRPQVQIRVEGNTDERSSREHNLALGDKRAQVVAKQLELMGAKAAQIEAVSYGEERPKSEGRAEAAHSENRRADIRYVKR